MKEKIDIVYTWVDGSDDIWRLKRKKAAKNLGIGTEQHGNVEGRFRDNGELKYSLRSLEKYFPDHGSIFIVTDHQIPDFLRDNTNITFIHHDDIIDSKYLPTFSSKNIEASISRIPNLSDRFLYFNDDVFLGPDFCIDDMFLGDRSIGYFVTKDQTHITPQIISSASSHEILRSKYPDYNIPDGYTIHVPKAINLHTFREFQSEFQDLFTNILSETFRTIQNPSLLSDMYVRWCLYKGYSMLGQKQDFYMESSSPRYDELERKFHKTSFFCINDTGDDIKRDDSSLTEISRVLEALFSEKSSFEG